MSYIVRQRTLNRYVIQVFAPMRRRTFIHIQTRVQHITQKQDHLLFRKTTLLLVIFCCHHFIIVLAVKAVLADIQLRHSTS